MAFIQKITPPPNKVLNFSLKDFSGGMNNRSDQIEDNEAAVIKNLMFADDTLLETRYGQKYYSEKDYGGKVIFIDEYKPYMDDNILVVAVEIETEEVIEGEDGEEDEVKIVKSYKIFFGEDEFDIYGVPEGINHLGRYYFADGKELKVYANFDNTSEGKNPITNKEDKDKDGNQSNDYFKTIGSVIKDYTVYKVVSPADGHAQLDTEHTRGVTVIDYNKKEVYYEPSKNEFEDTLLGACKVPEVVKYLVSHTGRLFASGHDKDDDNIFITDIHNPLYFAVGLPIQVPPSSDKVRGLHIFDNSVVIGREKDIYTILGSTNRPDVGVEVFKLKKLNTHTGFASNTAVNNAHNYMIFLGSDGNVYAMQTTRTYERDLATTIISRSLDLKKKPIDLEEKDFLTAVSYFYNDEWYLSMRDKTLIYNYRLMAWTMYKDLNMRSAYGLDGEWIWGRDEGKLACFDKENFFDFGEPYQSLWYSKIFDMDDANSFKQFREFFLVAHTFHDEASDIYVTFEVDYEDVKDRAIISNQISVWGKAVWGDRFITRNINESLPFIIGRRGRNIRFKITNGYYIDGEVDDYSELENYPEKRDGVFVRVKNDGHYLYFDRNWERVEEDKLNQRMKVYQVNGDFEMRGKR